jgi:hypothetical protein
METTGVAMCRAVMWSTPGRQDPGTGPTQPHQRSGRRLSRPAGPTPERSERVDSRPAAKLPARLTQRHELARLQRQKWSKRKPGAISEERMLYPDGSLFINADGPKAGRAIARRRIRAGP